MGEYNDMNQIQFFSDILIAIEMASIETQSRPTTQRRTLKSWSNSHQNITMSIDFSLSGAECLKTTNFYRNDKPKANIHGKNTKSLIYFAVLAS